jgi:hypothetical protein
MKPLKMKLHRDRVISVVDDWEGIVGVYLRPTDKQANSIIACGDLDNIELHDMEILLGEFTPKKADAIIKLWNSK